MATKKVGELIKEARTNAKLSQTALGELAGVSGSDIGKAERGEKELTQTQLKAIAKATGVTQKSLLEAPKGGAAASSAAKTPSAKTSTAKTSSAKTSTGKTSSAKTSTAKTSSASSKKTTASSSKKTASGAKASSASTTAVELTSAEKTMLNAYRKADADTRKAALKLLKGEQDPDILSTLLQSFTGGGSGNGGALGGGLLDLLGNLGKK